MINTRAAIRAIKLGLLAVFLVFTASSVSQAGPLGVPVSPYPSIVAGFISSGYNATTGAFSANGWALTLDTGSGKTNITTNFRITATIENSGVALNATLTVGTATSPLLFSNNLLGFAFDPRAGGALEFLFGTPSGSYTTGATPIYSTTEPLDVLMTGLGTGFQGTFTTSWSSSSNTAEIRPDPPAVSEPSTLLLMLAGAGGLYKQARRRKQA